MASPEGQRDLVAQIGRFDLLGREQLAAGGAHRRQPGDVGGVRQRCRVHAGQAPGQARLERTVTGRQPGSDGQPAVLPVGHLDRLRRTDAFRREQRLRVSFAPIGPGVHLAHARVDAGQHQPLAGLPCQGRQGRYRNHRPVQGEGDALPDRDGQPHAGEGARSTADGDDVQLRFRQAGLGQQGVRPRQREFGMAAGRDLEALPHLTVIPQRDRAGLGRQFERKQFHGISGAGATADSGAKNASTSSSWRVLGSGGSESMNTRP